MPKTKKTTKTSKKAKEANKQVSALKEVCVKIKTDYVNEEIHENMFDKLLLNNPENPAEVVSKMNQATPVYAYLGSAKAEMETQVASMESDFEIWMAKAMNDLNDDKDFKSEKAKQNHIISENEKDYRKMTTGIRDAKYILRKIDVARKAYDKYIAILQSIGAMIRQDMSKGNGEYRIPGNKSNGSLDIDDI
jgi:hypothetical protein